MLTSKIKRDKKGLLTLVNGKLPSARLRAYRIPPAWTDVQVDPSPDAKLIAIGYDVKGRKQYLYSKEHSESSKNDKFIKIRALIREHEELKAKIEEDINDPEITDMKREAAIVAYLIFETGIRPGSEVDTKADVEALGATTLQLRHVKPQQTCVMLKFTGKKGVDQNIKVTNPYLVEELRQRKESTSAYTTPLFNVSDGYLRQYVRELTGFKYVPKDLRTMRGTLIAMEFFGERKRIPKTKKAIKELINEGLDKVADKLGNTRAIAKSSYVDPQTYERFEEALK